MKGLTLRSRFRLFFHGAIYELALASSALRELRQWRDGMNAMAAMVLGDTRSQSDYSITVDAEQVLKLFERVYGVDHPNAARFRARLDDAKARSNVLDAKRQGVH